MVHVTGETNTWTKVEKWSKNFDERPHRSGRIFHGDDVMRHRPVGSIAVGCGSRANKSLLRTEWSFLLYSPQQRLLKLFNGLDNPKIAASHEGISTSCFIYGPFGPPESPLPVQPFFAQITRVPNTYGYTDQSVFRVLISLKVVLFLFYFSDCVSK